MSFGSFFGDVEKFFKKIFTDGPMWEHTAYVTLSVAAPLLQTVIGLTAGQQVGMEVAGVIKQVENDLQVSSAILLQAQASNDGSKLGALKATLTSAQANLQQLLAAADIKNAQNSEKIQMIVNTLLGEVQAVLALVPDTPGAVTVTSTTSTSAPATNTSNG